MSETLSDYRANWILKKAKIDFPELASKHLILDRLVETDIEAVFQYASDPQTVEWVSWQQHREVHETFRFIQSIENCLNLNPPQVFLTWAIRLKSQPDLAIGALNFSQFSDIAGQIDFVLGREYWNQGIATEAVQALIAWVFLKFSKLRRIQSHCVAEHLASRRVMEKCGMNFEGIRRDGIQMKNKVYDLAVYSTIREEALTQ